MALTALYRIGTNFWGTQSQASGSAGSVQVISNLNVEGQIASAAGDGCTVKTNYWGTQFQASGPVVQMPVSFELVLTDDLPNGPYGEFSPMGGGKLYVTPGSTYNDVAGALLAAWEKSRGNMMNMNTSQAAMPGAFGGAFGGEAGMNSSYSEDWKVNSMEYKGGSVDQGGQAAAGTHNAQLGITQTTSAAYVAPAAAGCCVLM